MTRFLNYGVKYATKTNGHDVREPTDYWVTPDGKPLEAFKWYVVILDRDFDPKRARWTFLAGPFETQAEAIAAGGQAP